MLRVRPSHHVAAIAERLDRGAGQDRAVDLPRPERPLGPDQRPPLLLVTIWVRIA